MRDIKRLVAASVLAVAGMLVTGSTAEAHLVAFGWKDNGNGTVTIWGNHWHGFNPTPYSDNIGVHIGPAGSDPVIIGGLPTAWPVFPWMHVANGIGGGTDAALAALVAGGTLTGYAKTGFFTGGGEPDWFYTDPLVIGNGTWQMMTGQNCCVDTMDTPLTLTLTGIISVPPGTGPGGVPEPASLALLGLSGLAAVIRRRRNRVA